MDTTKLITTLAGAVLLLLGVGWMLLRGFVSELREARDRIVKSADGWDETCELAAVNDRALALLEPRVARLEGHDFHKLNNDLAGFSLRLGRVEADVTNLTTKLADVHGMTHETNEIVKELRERRRVERGE
jgi:hypothetical protein